MWKAWAGALVLVAGSSAWGDAGGLSAGNGSAAVPALETPRLSLEPVPLMDQATTAPYELPAVTVEGGQGQWKEEQRVGAYQQPRWTAQRRFPTTRIYVIPEGEVAVEYWLRPTFNHDGSTDIRQLYEVEVGLPYRFQVDMYFRTDQTTEDSKVLSGGQFEVRYALADWGKIWGNPTFYAEYAQLENRPNRVEGRLLLGDELAPRWHWGVNIDWEQEIGRASRGEGEHEFEVDASLAYSLIDSYLSVGVESITNLNNTRDNRSAWNTEVYVGPSIQWHPVPNLAVNFAPLAGVSQQAGDAQLYLNVGWEF